MIGCSPKGVRPFMPLWSVGPKFKTSPAQFRSLLFFSDKAYKISGVTRDSAGNALGNCIVDLFYTPTDTLAAKVTSDASGNFSFSVGPSIQCYIVAYLPGSPDVAGTTVNTLTAV